MFDDDFIMTSLHRLEQTALNLVSAGFPFVLENPIHVIIGIIQIESLAGTYMQAGGCLVPIGQITVLMTA